MCSGWPTLILYIIGQIDIIIFFSGNKNKLHFLEYDDDGWFHIKFYTF